MGIKIDKILDVERLAEKIDKNVLDKISYRVITGYMSDNSTRAAWLERNKKSMDFAMQIHEKKSYPWANASNIKYPLIATGAFQFQARSFAVMVPGNDLVKAKIIGKDFDGEKKKRGNRISQHMSWQLMEKMSDWPEETDLMLGSLAILGSMFRKTYFSTAMGQNVSDLIFPEDLVVAYKTRSLVKAPRVTHIIRLYRHEILSRQRLGIFLDVDLGIVDDYDENPEVFLEQHCLYDLDDDGFPELYIVTVHQKSQMVVRIVPRFDESSIVYGKKNKVARIDPIEYFTKYQFIPSPDGGFYGLGFGALLGPINSAINNVLNMTLDSAHLANLQGGFIGSGMRLKKGESRMKPGEYRPVNVAGQTIRDSIVPINYPGPSPVMFSLLGFLVDMGNKLSSVQDIMTGKAMEGETATTSMIRAEQGAKLFTSITDRLHRSYRKELKILYRLNSIYLDEEEYFNVLDTDSQQVAGIEDYNLDDFDISPASDPRIASDQYLLSQASALLPFLQNPLIDPKEVMLRYFTAIKVVDPEALFAKKDPHAGPPPEIVEKMAKLENDRMRIELETNKAKVDAQEKMARIIKLLAEAEAIEPGIQLEQYKAQAKQIESELKQKEKIDGLDSGVEGVGAGRSDQRIPESTGEQPGIAPQGVG